VRVELADRSAEVIFVDEGQFAIPGVFEFMPLRFTTGLTATWLASTPKE